MLSDKRIAVAILNYNGLNLLKKFLPSVVKYSDKKLSNIYIIDNGSDDKSITYVKNKFSEVKIIQNDNNYGYAGGYNKGLSKIDYDYYVLLNNAVEVRKGWLNPLFELLESDENFATCQPKIKSYYNKSKFDYAGGSGGYLDFLGYPFCRGRIFDSMEEDFGQYDDKKEIFWSSGACFMIKSKVFKKLNGFDFDFFAHMEEIDLCWRLKNLKYKNYCQPKSIVYHAGGETLSDNNPRKTYLNFRNNLIMILKNDNFFYAFPKIFIRLIFDTFASILISIKKKNIFHLVSILKAYIIFFLKIPKIIFSKRVGLSNNGKLKKNILPFQYFIMGKKRFSDL